MSTQLVLGLAGAALLGPVGLGLTTAGTGWLIGSTIGGLLGGGGDTNTQGPRLNDLTVQASTYGTMVPVVYGAYKINGNVIFATDLREVSTTTEQSGKGGPTASQTTYSYNCDLAIALCDNTIASIRKIFNNGKLIFDASTGADIQTVIASDIRAAGLKVYLGTETQLPDPTLEAALGVGNVPAYRGTAYLVFSQLECPNGQIPQLSFEVLQSATVIGSAKYGTEFLFSSSVKWSCSRVVPDGATVLFGESGVSTGGVTDSKVVEVVELGVNFLSKKNRFVTDASSAYSAIVGTGDVDALVFAEFLAATFVGTGNVRAYALDGQYRLFTPGFIAYGQSTSRWAKRGNRFALTGDSTQGSFAAAVFNWDGGGKLASDPMVSAIGVWLTDTYVWFRIGDTLQVRVADTLQILGTSNMPTAMAGGELFVAPDDNDVLQVAMLRSITPSAWRVTTTGGAPIYEQIGVNLAVAVSPPTGPLATSYSNDTFVIVDTGVAANTRRMAALRFAAQAPGTVTVASVITDIAARAGLPAGQLDVTALTDTVQGYALTNVSSARANIDPLLKTFFIDPVKTDGKVKFRSRASLASVATITFDDLGAVQDGSDPGEPLPLQRTQEDDLPRSLAISFINPDADYQTGTETARRIVTTSINDQSMQLAVVMTSDRAATVASALMYNDWAERNKRSLKVSRKFAALDAGDVVTVEYPRGRFAPYRITRATDTGVTMDLDVVDFDGPVYTVQAKGSPPSAASAQINIKLLSPTRLEGLNIPILRDADDNAGVYVAMAPLAVNWAGAVLYVGADDANLEPSGSVTAGAVIGVADGVLGNWTQGVMDETNTVLVTVGHGDLFNGTRAEVFDKQANAALLGDELLQFTSATLVTGKQYRLSGLLRGQRGTEAARSTHAVGDRFVLLEPAALARPRFDVPEINAVRQFRAVTIGRQINSAVSSIGKSTGRGLRPFSPVNLRTQRLDNGDIRITWDRRTRMADNWLLGTVPLGEATESYEIEVSILGTLKRTLTASTAQVDYSLAAQLQDASNVVTTADVRVYQLSTTVGRGDVLAASINVARPVGGSSFPGGEIITLYPIVKAGSATVAVAKATYSGNVIQKVFESTDNGVSFAQLDGISAELTSYPTHRSGRTDGVYVSVLGERVAMLGAIEVTIARGVAGSLPVLTAAKFARPFLPVAIGNDGTNFYLLTEGNQVHTSANGSTWTNTGSTTGLPTFFRNESGGVLSTNYGGGVALVRAASRWFASFAGLLYFTSSANALTGWTAATLPANVAATFTVIATLGANLYAAGSVAVVGGNRSVILKSTDSGTTWTTALDPAVSTLADVYNLGGTLVGVGGAYTGKSNTSTDGTTWATPSNSQAYIDTPRPVQAGNNLVVAALRLPAVDGQPQQQLKVTTNGTTFTNSTGL